MGESGKQGFQLSFNRFLRVGFQGSRVTSNGGLILVRELDERLGFSELIDEHLTDSRANNARFSFADLLRQSVYSRLAGYEDVNDAERLSQDPTFRLIGSEKPWERGAALTSRLQTFETAASRSKRSRSSRRACCWVSSRGRTTSFVSILCPVRTLAVLSAPFRPTSEISLSWQM